MKNSDLILVADDKKLLELAKGSKIKFDKELIIDISLTILMLASKANPVTAVAGSLIGLTGLGAKATRFFAKGKEKNPVYVRDQVLTKIQEELNLSSEIHCIDPKHANIIKLDIGDKPTNGSFYIKHPLLDDIYIRPCDYESTLAREKEVAFRKLASCLGAKKITLKDAKFYDSKGKLSANAKLPDAVCTNIGIGAKFTKEGELIREVYSEFGTPRKEPYIPVELKLWTEIDPDLRTMAHDRLEGHLLKHQVSLRFKEDITGGGRVAAEIAKKGLDIGGAISKNVSSIWIFEVEYYPIVDAV